MKKLLAILFAALLACALALPVFATEEVPEIMPISAPVAEEAAEDIGFCDAVKLVCEGYCAGEFTLWDVLRAPFDVLF